MKSALEAGGYAISGHKVLIRSAVNFNQTEGAAGSAVSEP